jgi:hypothetical protein
MTVMEFPGRLIESEQLGAIWVPTATVEIKYRKLSLSCEMLVDTGAYLSMVPYQIGIELGLTISEDEMMLSNKWIVLTDCAKQLFLDVPSSILSNLH